MAAQTICLPCAMVAAFVQTLFEHAYPVAVSVQELGKCFVMDASGFHHNPAVRPGMAA